MPEDASGDRETDYNRESLPFTEHHELDCVSSANGKRSSFPD